jgi:hypothetical protein
LADLADLGGNTSAHFQEPNSPVLYEVQGDTLRIAFFFLNSGVRPARMDDKEAAVLVLKHKE